MKRMYESVVIFDGSLSDDVLVKEQEKVEKLLKEKTNYLTTDVWGKKTLAYEIKKKKSGYYCLFHFEGEGNVCDTLHKSYRLNQRILRHMTVLFEKEPEVTPDILESRATEEESEEGEL